MWALHVNYGLRAEADDDQAHCAELCERLGVELFVHRAGEPAGNVQAWAREVRYAQAERLAAPRDALIATGHTATDQVETVLYRLAASPGRAPCSECPSARARIIRPLLHMTREDTAAYCRERGLPWREDASNAASARGRIRDVILPALRELHPAAEDNILRTLDLLRDEAAVLDAAVSDALGGGGAGAGGRRPASTLRRSRPRSRGSSCNGSPTRPPAAAPTPSARTPTRS